MDFQSEKSFGKLRLRAFQPYHQILCMSKHVKDVEDRSNTPKGCNAMLCMSKMSKMHSIECIEYCTKDQSNVEDVEDRSNTPKGCNAMYVGDVEDGKRTYTHILAHNFLKLNGFSIRKKFCKAETESFPTIPSNSMYVEACRRCRR